MWCRGHGEWVAGLLLVELGLRLGLQLPGGGARPFPSRPPPPGCPLRVSKPSEFSSISWMRGGMEPGISIFSVITRSAPAGREGRDQCASPILTWQTLTGRVTGSGRTNTTGMGIYHTLHAGLLSDVIWHPELAPTPEFPSPGMYGTEMKPFSSWAPQVALPAGFSPGSILCCVLWITN
jgi:hypothetical protein